MPCEIYQLAPQTHTQMMGYVIKTPGESLIVIDGGTAGDADYLLYLLRGRMSKIATNISGGALVTLIAVFLYQAGIGHHLDKVIIGSIIPLVPGVNFTNAIRDIADQDYIAGSVRMLDALLVTFCIALGVGLIITGYHQLAGGLQL